MAGHLERKAPVTGASGDTPWARAYRALAIMLGFVGGMCVFVMMLLSVSDALLRTFLNAPIIGAHDVQQVLQVLAVACAIPLCVIAGREVTIDTVADSLPHGVRRVTDTLTLIVGGLVLGFLAYRCFINGSEAADFGEASLMINIPFGPFYHALGVGFVISALALFLRIRR